MAPIRTPRHRHNRDSQRPRSRASLTPVASVILGSHRIHLKSRKRYQQRQQQKRTGHPQPQHKPQVQIKKKSPVDHTAIIKARREQWVNDAIETQHIIFGSGKYVSGEPVSPATASHSDILETHDIMPSILQSSELTVFYPHHAEQDWRTSAVAIPKVETDISFTAESSLMVARRLQNIGNISHESTSPIDVGVLSFASAKRPGGAWLRGSSEQDEIMSRCSSLVASLSTSQASRFYQTHREFASMDGKGVHDHSMVYSPRVVVFRRDDAEIATSSFIPPYLINVVSAVPPNAAAIRQTYSITPETAPVFDEGIHDLLFSRLGRALRILRDQGNQTIILGAFGSGSNEVPIETIARVFAELLVTGDVPGHAAIFQGVFQKVIFALPGKQYAKFKQAFDLRVFEGELSMAVREPSITTTTFTIKEEPED